MALPSFFQLDNRKEVALKAYVAWPDLIQFGIFLVALLALVLQCTKNDTHKNDHPDLDD